MENLHKSTYQYYEEINPALIKHISVGAKVLDVGCGCGSLGEAIKNKGNFVTAIEVNEHAVQISKTRLSNVFHADIANFSELPNEIKNDSFDLIVFADVLEHVYDPFSILKNYQQLLKPDGKIIISLPNFVIWDVRLKFLFGIFNYTDEGTCDRTHIRFFTLRSMRRLIKASGLKIIKEDFNPGILRPFVPLIKKILRKRNNSNILENSRAIIDSPLYKLYLKYGYPIEKLFCFPLKALFAFQFVFITERN